METWKNTEYSLKSSKGMDPGINIKESLATTKIRLCNFSDF